MQNYVKANYWQFMTCLGHYNKIEIILMQFYIQ